jgi:hypothetical protein
MQHPVFLCFRLEDLESVQVSLSRVWLSSHDHKHDAVIDSYGMHRSTHSRICYLHGGSRHLANAPQPCFSCNRCAQHRHPLAFVFVAPEEIQTELQGFVTYHCLFPASLSFNPRPVMYATAFIKPISGLGA